MALRREPPQLRYRLSAGLRRGDLIAHRAGHLWGLDGFLEDTHMVEHYPALRLVVG